MRAQGASTLGEIVQNSLTLKEFLSKGNTYSVYFLVSVNRRVEATLGFH